MGAPDSTAPGADEFIARCKDFEKRAQNDPYYKMYGVAAYLVKQSWGNAAEMANGVSVLLVTWDAAFFNRFGRYNLGNLEAAIDHNLKTLDFFRKKDIFALAEFDAEYIRALFEKFLEALKSDAPHAQATDTPASVGKALHILCPDFFPLWDKAIARHYVGGLEPAPASKYAQFCYNARDVLAGLHANLGVREYISATGKTFLKLFDEYNYSKFSKNWPTGQ